MSCITSHKNKKRSFKMGKIQGFKYVIEGHEKLEDFAKGILALANLRSNNQGVVDFKTFDGTNTVEVIATHDNDDYLTSYVGEIKEKSSIDIYEVFNEVIAEGDKDTMDEIERKITESDYEYDYYIHYVSDI